MSPTAAGATPIPGVTSAGRAPAAHRRLDAAATLIRRDGLAATSVADLCAAAGLSKGAFFHHFASKEDLAVAAAAQWSRVTGAAFDAAEYRHHADPLDRVMGYVALRRVSVDTERRALVSAIAGIGAVVVIPVNHFAEASDNWRAASAVKLSGAMPVRPPTGEATKPIDPDADFASDQYSNADGVPVRPANPPRSAIRPSRPSCIAKPFSTALFAGGLPVL